MHATVTGLDGWYVDIDIDHLTTIHESVEELDLADYGNPRPS